MILVHIVPGTYTGKGNIFYTLLHTVRNIYPGKEWNRYRQKDLSRKRREQSTLSETSIQEKNGTDTVRKIYPEKAGNRAHCQKDLSRKREQSTLSERYMQEKKGTEHTVRRINQENEGNIDTVRKNC
jgi:hypothetical protein